MLFRKSASEFELLRKFERHHFRDNKKHGSFGGQSVNGVARKISHAATIVVSDIQLISPIKPWPSAQGKMQAMSALSH